MSKICCWSVAFSLSAGDESLTDVPRVAKRGLLVQPWARVEFGENNTRQIEVIARDYPATGSCIRN